MSQSDDGSPGPEQGFRWPTWVTKCPAYVAPVLYGLSSLAGVLASQVQGWPLKFWVIIAILAFVLATLILIVTASARKRLRDAQSKWIGEAEQEHKDAIATLLGDELHNLIHLVADALTARDLDTRKTRSSQARQSIVCAAANMVGRTAPTGTRANLFKLSDDGDSMELDRFFGRGDKSDRPFSRGDTTFDRVMANKPRWVPSVSADPSLAGQDLKYGTFLVHPVSIGKPNIYGMLTVDCMNEGDLEEAVDTPMMAVLSTLIAMTYECEKYPNPRK